MLREIQQEEPELDAALLDDVISYLKRFVDLPNESAYTVLAVWVIHTWAFDLAFVTPYLYISSKGPGTGKTRTMDVMGVLCRNADDGTDAPPHVLGQEIESSCPTLLVDEVDTIWAGSRNDPLKRILNRGYQKGGVMKRQRANSVETWSVFCPKILAGIRNNRIPQSLVTRCIPIEMEGRRRELDRFNKFHELRDPDRKKLVDRINRFVQDFEIDIANQRPTLMKALSDRQNEIVEPLLAIAGVLVKETEVEDKVVIETREDDLRAALRELFHKDAATPSHEQVFLARIRRVFDAQAIIEEPTDRIFTEDLLKALGSSYSARQLGILLTELGFVRTGEPTIRIDTQIKRGYMRSDFEPLFERYLDVEPQGGLHLVEDDEQDDNVEEAVR